MKSKTSFFNRTIFKKNVTNFWPIWGVYIAWLLISEPVNIWQQARSDWWWEYGEGMYGIMENVVQMMISPYMSFLFAAVMALAVFSYLYSAKNANMMHALPVNRLELFVTNYLSGLVLLLVPQLVTFFISVLVCMGSQITCMQYLLYALLCQMGVSFFAYSLAVFVAMFTGQMLAMPIYYVVVNFLYVGCLFIIESLKAMLCYGVTDNWNPGESVILSPLYYLGNQLRVYDVYNEKLGAVEGLTIAGGELVAVYSVAAVFVTAAAYQFYRRRQIETAGDWISVGFVKPVFRWGCGLCGGILLALLFTGTIGNSLAVNSYQCMLLFAVIMGILCFFAAEMLIRKQFKVFDKRSLLESMGVAVASVVLITLFEMDVFGIWHHVPAADEIAEAYVNMNYPLKVDEMDLEKLLAIHQDIIAHKEEYLEIEQEGSGYYYTTIRYYLKDGTEVVRSYPLAVREEYVQDAESPVSVILAWERDAENLKKNIFGTDYKEYEYAGGYIDVYDDALMYSESSFDAAQADTLVKAIMKDIEAGYYNDYYTYCLGSDDENCYYNNIYINYYSRVQIHDMWYYYMGYDKQDETEEYAEQAVSSEIGISFGTSCVNTIRALEEMGAVDETHKLYTQKEYAKAQ